MMRTTQTLQVAVVTALVGATSACAGTQNKEVEAIEARAEQEGEALERAEEASEEYAEGVAEAQSAAEGEGELRQEIEGHQAKKSVDAEFDQIEDAHEEATEQEKAAVREAQSADTP